MAQYGAASTSSKSIWDLDPRNIGGCTLWLDATDTNTMFTDAGTTLAGLNETVRQWNDKSGNGNHGIQTTLASRPIRVTDTGFSGLPSIYFDGGKVFDLDTNKLPTGRANSTIFAVFRFIPPTFSTQNNTVFAYGGATLDGTGVHRIIQAATVGQITMENGSSLLFQNTSSITTSCGVLMFQDFTMSGWVNGSAASSSPMDIGKDPGFATTGTGTTTARVGGAVRGGGGRSNMVGNIHEILIFNRGLGNAERQQIEGYLAWKWSFLSRLPTSHPYYSSTISTQEIPTLTSASIPSPNLWLDTSSSANILQYPVIQWYDKSGQNNHAVALSNSGYVNYTSGQFLTGIGTTGRLQILNPTDPFLNTTFTFFIIERRGTGRFTGVFGSSDNATNTGFYACYTGPTTLEVGFFVNRITYTVPAYNVNEPYRIWTFAFRGNGIGIQLWLNGTSVSSNAGSTQSTAVTAWSLFSSPHLNTQFDGNIQEVLSYKVQLNTNDQQAVEGYLAWKWGLQANLPVGHQYKNAAPSGFVPNTSITTSGATCRLWFDAADTTTVTQPLTRWLDKSGLNNHADARLGAGSSGNAMMTNALVNSRRLGVGGNGATTRLQITDVSTPFVNTTFTIFVVERRGSGKSNNTICAGSTNLTQNANLIILYNTNTTFRFAFFNNDLDYTVPAYVNTEPYRIWSLVFKAGSGGKEIWLNGTLVAQGTGQTANLTANIGWSLLSAPINTSLSYDGHIREIISYKTFLNTTDQQNVEGYLAWKWGLQANLPSAHPWSTTTSPGGYAGSYAPPNTSITTSGATCQLWFDGNDTTTMAETEFQIRDRSGNNRHVAGVTGTLTYTTGAQNGLNAIDFIQNSRLFTPPFVLATTSRLTLFVVLKQTSASISSTFDMFYGTPRTNLSMYLNTSGNYGTIANTTADSLTTFTSSQNVINIYRVTINVNGTAVNSLLWSRQYVNGGFQANFSTASLGTALSSSQVLNLLNGGMNGTLYEVLSYANELSEFQSRLVEGYLAWKWGIQSSLDSNHPYDAPSYLMDRTRPFARNFVPTDIDGCQLWIDPSDSTSVTLTGSNVISIADKSGLGNNAMNMASTITYTDTLNGKNVITSGSGTPSSFSPTSISGCALWLDATDSATVSVSGSNVTGWTDKSAGYTSTASNNTAIQYIPNAIGSLPVIRIGATAAFFTFGNINNIGTQEFNIFAVFKASPTGVNSIVGKGSAATTGWWFGFNASGSALQTQYNGGNISYTNTSGLQNYIIASSMNPRTSVPTHYYNGSSIGTGTANSTNVTNTSNLRVGSQQDNFTVTNTDFAEIIMYIGAISTAQRQQVEGYLAWKWGLAGNLPTTHPYYMNYPTTTVPNALYTSYIPRNPVNHSFFYVLKYPSSVSSGIKVLYYDNGYFGHSGTTAPLLEDNNVISGGVTASSPYGSYDSATAFYGGNTFVCGSVRQNEKITLTTNGRDYGTTGGSPLGNLTSGQYSIQLGSGTSAQLGELIVYNSSLSESERQMVEGYLMWKWGLRTGGATNSNVAIPTTHSYYKNPPSTTTPELPGLQLYRTAESVLGDLQPTWWIDPQDPSTYGVDANNRVQYIFNKRTLSNVAFSGHNSTNNTTNGSTYNTSFTGTPIFINQPIKMFGTIGSTSGTGLLYNTIYYAAHIYTVDSVAADGITLNISVTPSSLVGITTNRYVVFNADIPGTTPIKAGQLYFARTITGTQPTTAFTVSATSGGANITGLTPGTLTGVRGTHAGLMRFSLAPNDTPITTLTTAISGYFNFCDATTGIAGTGIGLNGPLLTQSAIGSGAGLNYFDFSTGGSFPITSASVGGGGTALTLVVGAKSVLITTGTITSNIATVSFIDPGYLLFAQGQQITISGSTTTGTSFNGTFTIISCRQTSVTFALTGTGTVTGGTISVFLAHNIPTTRQITLTISNGLYSDTTSATALTGTYTTQSGTTGNTVVLTIPSSPIGSLTGLVGRVDYGNILLTNIQMTNGSSTATFTTSGNHNLVATTDAIFLSLPDTTVTGFASTTGKMNRANGQYTVASTPTTTTFTIALKELGGSTITAGSDINQTLVSNTKPSFAYFPINGYCLENRIANYILPNSSGLNTIVAVTHLNPGPGTVISSQAARSGRDNATQPPIVSTSFTLDGQGGSDLNNINGVGAASSVGIGRDFNTRLSNFGSNGIRGSIRRCQSNGADVSPPDTSVITNTTNGFRIMTHTFCNTSSGSSDITTQSQSTAFGGWRNVTTLSTIQYNSDYYGYSSGSPFNFGGIRVIAGSTVGTTATLTLIPFGWEPGTNPFHVGQLVSWTSAPPVAGYNITNAPVTAVTPTTVSYTVASGTLSFTGGSGQITRTSANNVNTNINHLRIGADTSATKTYTSSFLTDNFFDGGVGDILIFNGALSLEQRQFVEGYLAQKYRFQQFLGTSTNRFDQDLSTVYTGLVLTITSATCAIVNSIPYVTLTFTNPRSTSPFVLASSITVANITTTGYTGTFYVTGYSTQSPWTVSYAVSSLLTTPAVLGTSPNVRLTVASTNLMVHPYNTSPAVIDGRLNLSNVNAQNLITWFDASNRSTMGLCGSRVCEWQSSGGTQLVLYQPFPQMQPLYVTNALNGLPGVRFMLPVVTGGTMISITSAALLRIIFPAGLVPTLYKVFIPSTNFGGLSGQTVYIIRSITFVSGTTYDVTFSGGQIFGTVFTSITAASGSVSCSFYDIGLLYSGYVAGNTPLAGGDSISTRTINTEFTYVIVYSRAGNLLGGTSLDGNIMTFVSAGNQRIVVSARSIIIIGTNVNVDFPTIPIVNTPYILVVTRRGNVYSFRLIGNGGYVTQTSTGLGDLRFEAGTLALSMGAYNGVSDTTSPFAGDIYETCLYRTALSEQMLQIIEGYLAWKWGFVSSLPSTHSYKKIRP